MLETRMSQILRLKPSRSSCVARIHLWRLCVEILQRFFSQVQTECKISAQLLFSSPAFYNRCVFVLQI